MAEAHALQRAEVRLTTLLAATRFLLELASVAGAAVAGASVSWVLGVVAAGAVIVVWATFVAPKSRRRLRDPARLGVELVLFAAIGAGLVASGAVVPGVVLASADVTVAVAIRFFPVDDPHLG